ncbi:MAG: GNAT family N-acetyltransferase [Bacilli bacterium]
MLKIEQVKTIKAANECDELLTKLIKSEQKYDLNVKEDFIVYDYYKNLYKNKNNGLFIAYLDNVPVGFIFGYIKYEEGPLVHNSMAFIDAFFVVEEKRNIGNGTKIINVFYDWCKEKNVKSIEIGVYKNNKDTLKLYEKYGFITETYYMKKELF